LAQTRPSTNQFIGRSFGLIWRPSARPPGGPHPPPTTQVGRGQACARFGRSPSPAIAGRKEWTLVLAAHAHPSLDQASPSKLASEPDLRQMNPVVDETGFITIKSSSRSLDGAKRNPGRSISFDAAPDYTPFHPGYEERKKRKRNAVRRCSVTTATCGLRHAPYGARTSSGVPPRLLPKGVIVPKAQLRPGFTRQAPKVAGYPRQRRPRLQRAPRTPVLVPAG
jgi:hypothetical protein